MDFNLSDASRPGNNLELAALIENSQPLPDCEEADFSEISISFVEIRSFLLKSLPRYFHFFDGFWHGDRVFEVSR